MLEAHLSGRPVATAGDDRKRAAGGGGRSEPAEVVRRRGAAGARVEVPTCGRQLPRRPGGQNDGQAELVPELRRRVPLLADGDQAGRARRALLREREQALVLHRVGERVADAGCRP